MSQSKTLLSYQMGYCGQVVDLDAMTPSRRLAYCLGVGHVAAGTLPLMTGVEVRKALKLGCGVTMTSVKRREGGDDETAAVARGKEGAVSAAPFRAGDVVLQVSRRGVLTQRYSMCDMPGTTFEVISQDRGQILIGRKAKDSQVIPEGWVDASDFARVIPSKEATP